MQSDDPRGTSPSPALPPALTLTDADRVEVESLLAMRRQLDALQALPSHQGWVDAAADREQLQHAWLHGLARLGARILDRLAPTDGDTHAGATSLTPRRVSADPEPTPTPSARDSALPTPPGIPTEPVVEAAVPAARAPGAQAPAPVPLTADMLRDLQHRMSRSKDDTTGVHLVVPGVDPAVGQAVLRRAWDSLGPTPTNLRGRNPLTREITALRDTTRTQLDDWASAGEAINHALTSWVVARMRAAQDAVEHNTPEELQEDLRNLFPLMTRHSRDTRPGSIRGLARGHTPPGNHTWLHEAHEREPRVRVLMGEKPSAAAAPVFVRNVDDDIRRLLEDVAAGLPDEHRVPRLRLLLRHGASATDTRLVNLASPIAALLEDDEFRDLRRALHRAQQDADEGERGPSAEETHAPPEGWRGFELTHGRHAVIVGGDPRPERLAGLQAMFGFASLDWQETTREGGMRHIDAVVERMTSGTLDLVLVLRAFTSHKVTDRIFNADTPRCRKVLVDSFTALQIRLGLERHLPGQGAGGTDADPFTA
jgi:hypothetical protein